MKNKRKPGSGGKRPGAGGRKKEPTKCITIRHKTSVIEAIRNKLPSKQIQQSGRAWLDNLHQTTTQNENNS